VQLFHVPQPQIENVPTDSELAHVGPTKHRSPPMTHEGSGSLGTLAFIVTEDWYFWSHRLPSARAAQAVGYDVVVIARSGAFVERIRSVGIKVIDWPVRRGSLNFFSEFKSLLSLAAILRRLRPAVVHNVALKPVIYGTVAAKLTGVPAIINSVTGFGFLFASSRIASSLSGQVLLFALRLLARRAHVLTICQNRDDADLIYPGGQLRDKLRVIKGSGVDVERFSPSPEPEGRLVATFVGRMLWEKGVGELVEAARILKRRGADLRLVLVGPVDYQNPGAIREDVLQEWQRDGLIDWAGSNDDIAEVWRRSHIAVLPSYREGLPKAALEAAACGRAVITTDVPGCRDIVQDEITGLLVPARDPVALADALQRLASSADLRRRMGAAGRAKVTADFADRVVIEQMSKAYRDVLFWLPTAASTLRTKSGQGRRKSRGALYYLALLGVAAVVIWAAMSVYLLLTV
jgi:glycosyltransferase involved in cell wall biosynthesis